MNRIYDSRAHRQCELVGFFKCVLYILSALPRQRFSSYIKIILSHSHINYKLLCARKAFATFLVGIFYAING